MITLANPRYYAGLGSRKTPKDVLDAMYTFARIQAFEGWGLRSGGADGADTAFEKGCDSAKGEKEIWLPWNNFNGSNSTLILPETGSQFQKAMTIAKTVHPVWHRCSTAAKRLHARNVLQILGPDFKTPVEKVICWTPNGEPIGGTRTAIVLAELKNIKVLNLGNKSLAYDLLMK